MQLPGAVSANPERNEMTSFRSDLEQDLLGTLQVPGPSESSQF